MAFVPTDWAEASGAHRMASDYIRIIGDTVVIGDHANQPLRGNFQFVFNNGVTTVNLRDGQEVLASFKTDEISLGNNSDEAALKLCGNKGVIKFIKAANVLDDDMLEITANVGINAGIRLKTPWSNFTADQGFSLSCIGGLYLSTDNGTGTLTDWPISRVQHSSRDAIVTTWASGRVEVNGTITKNHSGSTSQDQLPSITEFKADATYNKSVVTACNGDYTAKQFFVTGCGIKQDGSVYCGISPAYTGSARLNYYYDLR